MAVIRFQLRRLPDVAALAVLLALTACASEPPQTRTVSRRTASELAAVRLDPAAATAELNAYRSTNGLAPVRLDSGLTAMAERQAKAMAAGDTLSHEVAGSFRSRLVAGNIDGTEAGENIGAGYMSVDEAMSGWRRSPEHDANLLMPAASRFGIAVAKNPGSQYGAYWAMEMASGPRPRASESSFLPLSGAATETR
jgi:uncharacterized protein YkwD